MNVPHIPALRRGQPYESLEQIPVKDHRTGMGGGDANPVTDRHLAGFGRAYLLPSSS